MRLTRAAARAALAKEKEESQPFRILDLPPELVEQTFQHFLEEDCYTLLIVRRVCRAFATHSIVAFGTCFFEHLSAMLHPLSLSILLEIANHNQLSKFARQVTISGERIGGVLDLGGHYETQKLKDLQTSMELSGMDQLVLTEVFRKLPRLATVRIDNDTFRCSTDAMDATRCGLRYFPVYAEHDLESPERGRNRALNIVLTCLRSTGLADRVEIHLDLHVMTPASQKDTLLDVDSRVWSEDLAPNIKSLELSGALSSCWTLDLLRSVSNLQTFQVFVADGIFQLTHPDGDPIAWQNLRCLKLDHVDCHAQTLIDILNTHKDTILELTLQMMELLTGSWKQVLQTIDNMPMLQELFIGTMFETNLTAQLDASYNSLFDYDDWTLHRLHLFSKPKICFALGAILEDFRTTECKSFITSLTNARFYEVDLKRAHAIIDGKMELRDGRYQLPPQTKEG
jgi:hypothetical protein